MLRVASHYICADGCTYRLHYLELDNDGCVSGIYPFREEIARTIFVDGIVFPVLRKLAPNTAMLREQLIQLNTENPEAGYWGALVRLSVIGKCESDEPVDLFRLRGIHLVSPEFGANNGCSNCYIERL